MYREFILERQFLSSSSGEERSVPTILMPTYVRATELLEKARRIKKCSHQAIHLSQAAFHLVLTLRNVLEDTSKAVDPHKLDRVLELDELVHILYGFMLNLTPTRIIERIMEAFDDPKFLPTNKEMSLQLFTYLCGQHYGVQSVRRSLPLLRRFQNWDLQQSKKTSLKSLSAQPMASSVIANTTVNAFESKRQYTAIDIALKRHQANQDNKDYMKILNLLIVACEPLTSEMINRFLDISNSSEILRQFFTDIAEISKETGIVQFCHPDIRAFLGDPQVAARYHIGYVEAHENMADRCLAIMNDELRYDIANLSSRSGSVFSPPLLKDVCLQFITTSLRYSCKFWGIHIAAAGGVPAEPLQRTIERFFQEKLLDWLYMVSLQDMYDEAMSMMRRLTSVGIVGEASIESQNSNRIYRTMTYGGSV
jgi:hypothetical protein